MDAHGEIGLAGVSLLTLLSFFIEFLRGDIWGLHEIFGIPFTQNQVIHAVLFIAATSLYFWRKRGASQQPVNSLFLLPRVLVVKCSFPPATTGIPVPL